MNTINNWICSVVYCSCRKPSRVSDDGRPAGKLITHFGESFSLAAKNHDFACCIILSPLFKWVCDNENISFRTDNIFFRTDNINFDFITDQLSENRWEVKSIIPDSFMYETFMFNKRPRE
jgi:hypothetical protein